LLTGFWRRKGERSIPEWGEYEGGVHMKKKEGHFDGLKAFGLGAGPVIRLEKKEKGILFSGQKLSRVGF